MVDIFRATFLFLVAGSLAIGTSLTVAALINELGLTGAPTAPARQEVPTRT